MKNNQEKITGCSEEIRSGHPTAYNTEYSFRNEIYIQIKKGPVDF
jgi:hypothetical protein